MSLSTCEKCGGHIPLGPRASNCCENCGEHAMGRLQYVPAPCCFKHKTVNVDQCPLCVKEERDRLQGIIYAALCAAPVGYIPTHDEDHLSQIVADLADAAGRCGAAEDERDSLAETIALREKEDAILLAQLRNMAKQHDAAVVERDRLRELIPQAWHAGEDWAQWNFDGHTSLDEWMKQKGLI
jgi:hypothetical protein